VGETQKRPFQLSFNGSLRVEFQGARVTSDGGLILVRELDERLGFGELIERHLTDARGENTQLPATDAGLPKQRTHRVPSQNLIRAKSNIRSRARLRPLVTPELHTADFAWERRSEDDCRALSMRGQAPCLIVGHGT